MESINEFKDRMADTLEEVKAALAKSKDDMTLYYNRKLSWSMLGHVLSKEQSKVGSDRVSDDGRLTIVQCHHYHRPPSSDLYRSSVGILPYSDTTNQTCILIIVITNQHHVLSTAAQPQPHHAPHTFHVPGQSHRARTSLEAMSRSHHKDLRGFTSASFGTIRNMSLLVICSFYYHMLSR